MAKFSDESKAAFRRLAVVAGVGASAAAVGARVAAMVPGGQAAALGIAVGSLALVAAAGAAGWISTDPPRWDFDNCSLCSSVYLPLPEPSDELAATFQEVTTQIADLALAYHELLVSVERSQGAALAKASGAGDASRYLSLQEDAVRHNAAAAGRVAASLIEIAPKANAAWDHLRSKLGRETEESSAALPAKLLDDELVQSLRELGKLEFVWEA